MNTSHLRILRKPFGRLSSAERDRWTRLLSESVASRWAFLSPTYAEAVNSTVGPVEVLLCWDDDALVGVMPLQRMAGWLGWLGLREPVGREMTDYFGLLARPGIQVGWSALLQAARIPCLYFTHLDESQTACGLHGENPTTGLRTRIPPEGAQAYWEWLRARDKKFTSNTERRERKLIAEHGPIEFEMRSSAPARDLEFIVTFKNAQYRRTGRNRGALLNPANVHLLTRLLRSCDPDCMPRLSVLRCSGQSIAAHFGLQCGEVLHYWFPVYDPRFANYSPGQILYRKIMSDAMGHGITCIDRGAGDSTAKRSFANDEHLYFRDLVQVGTRGRVLDLMQRARWRFAQM